MTDRPQVRRLTAADAPLYKEIRLEALQRSPEAFGSTFEHERTQSLAQFGVASHKQQVMPSFMTQHELNRTGTETVGAVVDQYR